MKITTDNMRNVEMHKIRSNEFGGKKFNTLIR
jgi:hypothetical protein